MSAAEADRKAWSTAQAKCLLAGFTAALIDDDGGKPQLIVSRWALTRAFASPAEAEAWLRRVGAPA